VIGVLVEKGITTPEVYPLTVKAVVSGCNQKSNRDPVVNYDEDRAETVLEELREMGLVAQVFTESGRTARYRHYVRKRFTVTEPQLAILTELLLRGQQAAGELRTRASRMAPIDTLEQLRTELEGLMAMNLVRADGPLDRRGVEVDHNLYPANEKQPMRARSTGDGDEAPVRSSPIVSSGGDSGLAGRVSQLETLCETLRSENATLNESMSNLRDSLRKISDELNELRRALGG
jgi:uncharacterized protein YceH (UPF0502 family)